MTATSKKTALRLKPKILAIRWYPSPKSCITTGPKRPCPHNLPPLMVRKAEWRR